MSEKSIDPSKFNPERDDFSLLDKDELIEWLGDKGRPTQKLHGSKVNGTQAAHRFPHSEMLDVIESNEDDLTSEEIWKLAHFIDNDLRIGPEKWNKQHSALESQIRKVRASGDTVNSKQADRLLVWIDQVHAGVRNGELSQNAARVMLEHVVDIQTANGLTVLKRWQDQNDFRKVDRAMANVFDKVYNNYVDRTQETMSEVQLNDDGTVSKSSSAVKQGVIRFRKDGKVNKGSKAYKQGYVDEDGHLISLNPGKSAESTSDQSDARVGNRVVHGEHFRHVKGYTKDDGTKVKAHWRKTNKSNANVSASASTTDNVSTNTNTRARARASASVSASASTSVSAKVESVSTKPSTKSSSSSSSGSNVINVAGYTRSNGTHVAGYTRSLPTRSSGVKKK